MSDNTIQDKAIVFLRKKSEYLYRLQTDAAFLAEELNKTGQKKAEESYLFYSALPASGINKFRLEILDMMRKGKKINKYALAIAAEKYFENAIFMFQSAFFDIIFTREEQAICREYLSMLAESIIAGLKLKNRKYIIENFSERSAGCTIEIWQNEGSLSETFFGVSDLFYFRKPEIELAVLKGKFYYSTKSKQAEECESFEEVIAFLSDRGVPRSMSYKTENHTGENIAIRLDSSSKTKEPEIKKFPRPWKWMLSVENDQKLWNKCLNRDIVAMHPGKCANHFIHNVEPGDIIYVKHKKGMVIARGVVRPGYEFINEEELHTRKIEWTNVCELKFNDILLYEPFSDITRHTRTLEKLDNLFRQARVESPREKLTRYGGKSTAIKQMADNRQAMLLKGKNGVDLKKLAEDIAFYILRQKDEGKLKRISPSQSAALDNYMFGNKELSGFPPEDPFIALIDKAKANPFIQYAVIAENIDRSNAAELVEKSLMFCDSDTFNSTLLKIAENLPSKRPALPANVHIIATMDSDGNKSKIAEKLLSKIFCIYEHSN